MSVLWVVPLLVLGVGLVVVAVAVHTSAAAVASLRDEADRLAEVNERLTIVDHGMRDVRSKASTIGSRLPNGHSSRSAGALRRR